MQELKLSQTLDGANMSPYHTTGEFATSLVSLMVAYVPRSRPSLSRSTNTSIMCFECVLAYRVLMLLILTAGPSAIYLPPSIPPRSSTTLLEDVRHSSCAPHSYIPTFRKRKPQQVVFHATKSQLQSILLSSIRFILVLRLRSSPLSTPARDWPFSQENAPEFALTCVVAGRRLHSPKEIPQSAIENPRMPKVSPLPPRPSPRPSDRPTETV